MDTEKFETPDEAFEQPKEDTTGEVVESKDDEEVDMDELIESEIDE